MGSRGGVIPVFLEQRKRGKITITDRRMTRFCMTVDEGVQFIIGCLEQMHGGEIFVPKIPSMRLMDLADAIATNCQIEDVGIRAGEKLHEVLVSEDEARNTLELENMYLIQPAVPWCRKNWRQGRTPPEGFSYASNSNEYWITKDQLRELVRIEESEMTGGRYL